jgi:iron-sulfur cluster insertion protein
MDKGGVEKTTSREPEIVALTQRAADKIFEIVQENEDIEAAALRIYVKGGGCAGFEYSIQIDEGKQLASDRRLVSRGVSIVIDAMSAMYLMGDKGPTEIDYVETELLGAGFKFNNPNASSVCGCGKSFNVN